jgi:bifunctional enzyme CysN/CysC
MGDPANKPTDKGLLRFITCGSVDDGKSTLIGRLLFDAQLVPDDQVAALARDSQRYGTTGATPDLALLTDGLQAEREQGITIDVAYRYFHTARRTFIVADAPGHEQYTRNMATGASTCDLAVILIDARKGVLTQTRRHSRIVSLLGIRDIVLAVNKMDLVGHDEARFREIAADYEAFATSLGRLSVTAIPISALHGDNVIHRSAAIGWYQGPTLIAQLENAAVAPSADRPFRFAVQWVCRADADFRGYAGTILGGRVRPDDEITVLPSGARTRIARIVTADGDLDEAQNGAAVMLTLADAIDVARGDMLAEPARPPHKSDQFAADLLWMHDTPLLPGRSYLLRLATATVNATVTELKHRIEVNGGGHEAAKQLALNEIGFANLALDQPLPFDSYDENRSTGGFILIDRLTNATVGAGLIRFPLRRADNLTLQSFSADKAARARIKRQRPAVLWFTGLSGAGKSTIADGVETWLLAHGYHTYILDGDNVRHGLNRDLGFTDADRVENIRRVIEVARLFADAGLIVLVSFISPFRSERRLARERIGAEDFLEVFVDTPLAECERRDPKGLYGKARRGEIVNFTGLDSAYEPPARPDIHLETLRMSPDAAVETIVAALRARNIIR